ncbi:OLC1v1029384C1 [Oldenlandia corymbosa var. corymbosa]|uniref:OLC1v1029384C1 n=1 Tax=Oldenlandia corymbosa var. corymbosa TaxID=529605 RepID=A0AAV1CGU2_OLDCO|nr:OLC1v1029384C1 [Oldenlandia corymbosa var. corymbosa]
MIFHISLNTSTNSNSDLLSYALCGLAIIWFALIFIKKSNKEVPPLPPGPQTLPLVGNLLSLDPELHAYFTNLSKSYGPILTLRLGKIVGIVISSPALAREVLKDQDTIFANRDVPAAGREAVYGGSDIVWNPYGPEWRMLRKVSVRGMLSNATLDSVSTLRRKEIQQMIKFFYKQSGKPINVGEQMFLTVLNVTTHMLWGGTVKGDERTSLGAEFRQVIHEITQCLGMPNISDFYPALARFDLQGIQKKTKISAGKFDRIFERLIDQRMKEVCADLKKSKDFLQFLLKMKDEGDGKTKFTMTHLKALFMDMVVAGTDTSSNTMEFALSEMMYNPETLSKVQQELETVVGKNRTVEESDIQNLPYLYAVMKETLRLHPILPLLVPHCPRETCIVGEYTIPKGARVFINAWAVHRDPSIWENPLEFRPERFLGSKMLDYSGNDFSYFPFGSGRRICAGTEMAVRMFMLSLASLVHSFDWTMPDGESLDVEEKFGIVLKKRKALVAKPTPRLSDASLYL